MDERPNILWYCTDQQRFDTIGALGNPHIRTPTLDALTGRGVAFRRAYAQSQICTPSRATFLTGRYPATHHVHRNGAAYFPPHEPLVTKLFAEAGYDCGLIGKLHLSRAKWREERPDDGYRVFHWSHHPRPDLDPAAHAYHQWLVREKGVDPEQLYATASRFCGPGVPAELHQTSWCTEMAIRFLYAPRDRPWLLSVNPFDPHPPFDPPAEFLERYDPDDLPPPLFRDSDIERQHAFQSVEQQSMNATDPREDPPVEPPTVHPDRGTPGTTPAPRFNGRKVKAAYYAMIELIDDQLGRLLDALEATGQLADTIILFHSDHGELLGDHGLIYKGCRFFEGLVHVPLIVVWPGRFKSGLVSDALVELVDIAPTLMEAAGFEIPANMQGRSLAPLLAGEAPAYEHKPHVVAEYNDALGSAPRSPPSHATMRFDGRFKTVVYHGLELVEIFDLEADPGEFDNLWLAPDGGDMKRELMHAHLDAIMATSSAGVERTGIY